MRPGIRILEETIGTGPEAVRGKIALVEIRALPESGEMESIQWTKNRIDLSRREHGAAVRYGLEGMKTGGRRLYVASANLTNTHQPQRFEIKLVPV